MKPTDDRPWPPLITSVKVPWHLRARDWILTFVAWFALLYMLRPGWLIVFDYYGIRPLFPLPRGAPPDWKALWLHFYVAVYASIFLVLWIVIWTVRRLNQIKRIYDPRQVHPLTVEEHARSLGLDPEKVKQWRQFKVATVQFTGDDMHQIADVQSGDTLGKGP
jgi:poly-beta-1,6-N-acetyl-D-glucosamine biosynthesis protein PgaD